MSNQSPKILPFVSVLLGISLVVFGARHLEIGRGDAAGFLVIAFGLCLAVGFTMMSEKFLAKLLWGVAPIGIGVGKALVGTDALIAAIGFAVAVCVPLCLYVREARADGDTVAR